jgi:hypothetical protein
MVHNVEQGTCHVPSAVQGQLVFLEPHSRADHSVERLGGLKVVAQPLLLGL